ncbi:MAG: hypothetical protein DHS20C02_20500 [Micavibrio sp.]|nr:MAG: hypothetical protein DHS20C02_20500 [Micavibrio sp.]
MIKRKNKTQAANKTTKATPKKPASKKVMKKAVKRMAAKGKTPEKKDSKKAKPAKAAKPGPKKAKDTKAAKPKAASAPDQTNATQTAPQQKIDNLPLVIHGQYIRDASFENPNAPQALRAGQPAPKMNVNFGLDARTLNEEGLENMFEVLLSISVEAKRDDKSVFIAEVQYGTTVSVGQGVPQEQIHPLLLIEVPRLAFPFARQILSELAVQGGYPPLLLSPVNFQQLYVERFKNDLAKQA